MKPLFSRRTMIAAIDMFEDKYHADLTAFLTELGPAVYTQIRNEPISLKKRLSDFKQFVDQNPGSTVEGEPLVNVIVERAASFLPRTPEHSSSRARPMTPAMETFIRVLDLDGYAVTDGTVRRTLPTDIGLPETESELMQLMTKYGLDTPKGHLQQALDAHARANWAGANGQIRTFFDALLDAIAERVDPSAATLATGQPRRAKLASHGFLSVPLNEWADDGKGFINGLVRRLHPAGPHPGLSDEDDSTFRLHTVLLTTTLLLRRLDRGLNP
jgi:hypothetical protein